MVRVADELGVDGAQEEQEITPENVCWVSLACLNVEVKILIVYFLNE